MSLRDDSPLKAMALKAKADRKAGLCIPFPCEVANLKTGAPYPSNSAKVSVSERQRPILEGLHRGNLVFRRDKAQAAKHGGRVGWCILGSGWEERTQALCVGYLAVKGLVSVAPATPHYAEQAFLTDAGKAWCVANLDEPPQQAGKRVLGTHESAEVGEASE